MRSDAIFTAIEQIADASGKQKEVLLRQFVQNDEHGELKQALKWALDPQITFGVIPDADMLASGGSGSGLFHETAPSVFHLLKRLAERELTGNNARNEIVHVGKQLSVKSYKLLMRVISKDLRCGLGGSTVNKVMPGLLSEFNVMLAAPYEPEKLKFPVRLEPKYDGMRVVARRPGFQEWAFFTRSGKSVDTVPEQITIELEALYHKLGDAAELSAAGVVFDGELMGESFKETMEQARRKDSTFENARFHVFDWLPLPVFEDLKKRHKEASVYDVRRKFLQTAFRALDPQPLQLVLPTSYLANSIEEVEQYYTNARARGLEGLIIKNIKGHYHPKRHADWMKRKAEETIDLPIVDVEEGTGKYAGMLGAFVVQKGDIRVSVGGGYSDRQRQDFWTDWHQFRPALEGVQIEIEYQEETPDGSLRHPRFVRLRTDKEPLF